jgi:hypothetical protein
MTPPPPVIASTRILEIAAIDHDVILTGRSVRFMGGREPGTAPLLAIGADLSTGGIRLLHCDEEWNRLGVSEHGTSDDAKRAAEEVYAGVTAKWRAVTYSDEEVAAFLAEEDEGLVCSFCGRHPHEYEKLVTGHNGAAICDHCIRSFREDATASRPPSRNRLPS